MIRTVPSRPARAGVALAGVAGIIALAGCAATATTDGATDSAGKAPAGGGSYTDGSYTAEGTYSTPESVETIDVSLTIANDVVTAVEVTGDPQKAESRRYQSQFIGGIAAEVVGKDLDQLDVSRVAGSSLTSGGFNQALEQIKQQAAA